MGRMAHPLAFPDFAPAPPMSFLTRLRHLLSGAVLLLAAVSALGQGHRRPPEYDSDGAWAVLTRERGMQPIHRLTPPVLSGDYDGDGIPDHVLLVREHATGKEGIAFLFGGRHDPLLLGAGRAFGNGGDDFSWMDRWSLAARGATVAGVQLQNDAVVVEKSGAASALIYLDSGKPVWRQLGD